uniref:Aminotransferase-like plant mobile domain-containing protein n=1 Tax=Ananas comosus var. bracteatus TaxID=296719 RepID=A0A6V7Q2C6_ANACO|nr:unnamed protein product [Ananas comosus var. bracteatus]
MFSNVLEICQELLGVVPDGIRAGQIRLDWIYQHFHHIHLDAPAGLVAATARVYMLYQIGCSLFPNPSGYRVHLKWLPLLADFDACGGLAWGAAALAYLYRALGTASLNEKVECCCFATLVQIWAWDHLHVGRPTSVGAIADMTYCPLGCRDHLGLLWHSSITLYYDGVDTEKSCDDCERHCKEFVQRGWAFNVDSGSNRDMKGN